MRQATLPEIARSAFVLSVEVVPPRGDDASGLLKAFSALSPGMAHFFNVADSPMARPRMSPTVLAGILHAATGFPGMVHLTVRDRNRVALESEILGARALHIHHQLAISGDSVKFCDRGDARAARDMRVVELVRLCVELGQTTGVVFDVVPDRRAQELRKMDLKVRAGASFIITQPVYLEDRAGQIVEDLKRYNLPVLMGILPLYSTRHAEFLHANVPGIPIPESIRERIGNATHPASEGVAIARSLLQIARGCFQGACIMPPFGHYELAAEILSP